MLQRLTNPSPSLIILLMIVSLCVSGVAEANNAPTPVGTIADQALDVGGTAATVDVSANFSDADGDTLTYTVSSSDTAIATASVSEATVTITPVAAGTATITVTATDPGDSTATQAISVTVTQPNRAPTAVGTITDQTVNVGANPATVDVSANFSDPDSDTLTYTATSSDTAIATVSVSGATITLTFVAEGAGTATITVTATDPDGLTADQTIAVTVTQPNRAPIAVGTIADQAVDVGGTAATIDVSANFSDPDSDTLTYTATASDTAIATVSVSSATVTLTAVAAGSATITVTATDPDGLTADQTLSVTVTQPNRAPAASGTIPDGSAPIGGTAYSVDASTYFTDADNDTLTYTASSSDTAIATASVSDSTVTVTGVAAGSATITVTATDPDSSTADQTFSVTVTQPNRAPTAVGTITDQALDVGGTAATVDVSSNFSDPDSDTLTYTATASDTAKATVSVSNATVTITAVAGGTATITVTATDTGSLTAEQTFSVTVTQPNRAPTIVGTISDQTANIGESDPTVDVSANFSDPDSDTLTYTATSSEDTIATVSVSGAIVTLTPVAAGTATITVTATDPDGLTANQTFSVTTNNAPTAVGTIPNRTLVISGPTSIEFAHIGITGYFSDADGDALTYSVSYPLWRNVATADFRTGAGTVTITPISNGTSGTITVTVTATDTAGASASQSFSVTVNRSPTTVGTIADRSLTRSRDGSSLTVDVSSNFSDPDGETLTYTASSSDTAVVTVDVSSATLTVTEVGAGTATITATATDPGGESASQTFSVSVNQPTQPSTVGTIPDYTLKAGKTLTIEASQYFNDPDGVAFKYTESLSGLGPTISRNTSGTIVTFQVWANSATGSMTATIVANGEGPTLPVPHAVQTFTITVVPSNRAPTAEGTISNQTFVVGGNASTVDVSDYFSDPDGDALTYTASSSDTARVTVSLSDETLTVTPVAAGGSATITVTATDTDGATGNQTFTVLVKGPPVTVGTIPLQKLEVGGDSISFHVYDLYFHEPDGNMTGSGMSHPNTAVANIWINPFNNHLLTISPVGKGTDSVQITMIDPEGTATQQLSIRVFSGPDTNGTIPDVSLNVGESGTDVDVSAYFDASDMSDLSYTAVSSDTTKATVSVSGSTLTLTAVAAGTVTITVRAGDSAGKHASQTFTATVVQPNRSPVAVGTIPSDQKIKIGGNPITIDVKPYFSDPDGDALTYHLWRTSGPASIIFSFEDGVLTVNTNGYQTGTPQFRAVARDPDQAWAEQRFSITVLPANRAPVANGTIPDSTKKVGPSDYEVDLSTYFTDADSDPLTYAVVSSDTAKATVSLSDATLSVTPVAVGTSTITTTATDPDGTFATQTFTMTVKQANRTPTVSQTIPDQTIERTYSGSNLDTNAHIGLSDKFSDADGDALTYTATVAITSAGYFVHVDFRRGANTLTITAPQADVGGSGTTTVTVTATDTDNASVSQTFSVTTSIRPTAVGTIPAVIVDPNGGSATVTLTSHFSDADGDTLTYTASSSDTTKATVQIVSDPSDGVQIIGGNAGPVTVTVTATDPIGLTATQTIKVSVGNPPTAVGTISDVSINTSGYTDADVNASSYFSDADGDTLSYSASSSNSSIAGVSVSGSTVTVEAINAGNVTITVTATDPSGLSATQTFTTYVTSYFVGEADAIPGLSSGEQSLLGQLLTYDTLIFNELHNATDDANDWLELRNVSNVNIPLNNWQLTVQTGSGTLVIPFPTGTVLAAGEVLLLVNTDNPLINGEALLPIVSEAFALPQTEFALILRSPTAFGDLAGNYFQDGREPSETTPAFATDTVWYRSGPTVSGYRAEAWTENADGFGTPGYHPRSLVADMNSDGVVNILDLVLVASQFGTTGTTADLNGDNTVNIQDLVLVANALDDVAAAPAAHQTQASMVNNWLRLGRQNVAGIVETSLPKGFSYEGGILTLEALVRALTPETTALLANYPNPFNPETWIPYQLANASDVTITIYAADGSVVRTLALGHQDAGMYHNRSQAAYWDGRNALGETVASGVYFYTLTAGDFAATRKMLILK